MTIELRFIQEVVRDILNNVEIRGKVQAVEYLKQRCKRYFREKGDKRKEMVKLKNPSEQKQKGEAESSWRDPLGFLPKLKEVG